MIAPEVVLKHLSERLPQFEAAGIPKRLSGGYLNYVWRVQGTPNSAFQSVIVKHAPPYIAFMPDIPLDPKRLLIEAKALAAFGPKEALSSIASSAIRPPYLLDVDANQYILLMEDVGEHLDLGTWVREGQHTSQESRDIGSQVGQFIARLHLLTYNEHQLAQRFDNSTIQQARLEGQYRAIEELAVKSALSDAKMLGQRAVALGELFLQPGRCVIMGDLWPPSLLMTSQGGRIIDWELSHFGSPVQDVSHLAAHLWMHYHRAPNAEIAAQAQLILQSFLQSYRATIGERFDTIFGRQGIDQACVHFGAELFVRAVGAYQSGYLYDGLARTDPIVQQAVQIAATHIRTPERVDTFRALRARN